MTYYIKKWNSYFNSYFCFIDFKWVFSTKQATSFETKKKAEEYIDYLKKRINKDYIEYKNLYSGYKNPQLFLEDLEKVRLKWEKYINEMKIVDKF